MMKMINKTFRLLFVMALWLSGGVVNANMTNKYLWGFIPQLGASLKSLSVRHLEQFPLALTLQNQTDYIYVYRANSIKLENDTTVTDIELRISKSSDGIVPFLSFSPAGKCTTLDDVRKHYSGVILSDYPRGQSENEVTSYTSPPDVDGQVITFSFAVKNPDCLSRVIITAKE